MGRCTQKGSARVLLPRANQSKTTSLKLCGLRHGLGGESTGGGEGGGEGKESDWWVLEDAMVAWLNKKDLPCSGHQLYSMPRA